MNETHIRSMSYRDIQRECKSLGISAKGKTSELQDRLIEYFNCNHPSEITQMMGTPIHDPGAENLPPIGQGQPTIFTPPGSETKRRVLAQKALDLAAKTPLPEQFDVMASPAPKTAAARSGSAPVVKRSSGGCGLLLMFLLSSVFCGAVCMYTYRINWDPIMKAGKQDVQAGLKEYTRQAHTLGEMDYADFLATKEIVTIKAKALYDEHLLPLPDRMQELYGEYSQKVRDYFSDLTSSDSSGASPRSSDNSCQAAVNGFEITFFAPSRTFDAHHEDHGKALMKVLMDLSNVHQRFKSVTHLVEYPESQDAVPTVEYSMKTLGCEGTLKGQCMVIDFGSLVEEEDQGAALQALVAEQLKESPSSMFFIANIEYLDASGAAVLLALIGEHGVLNQPGCDISTQASAALIFVPADVSTPPDILETLEEFEATIANNLAVVASHRVANEDDASTGEDGDDAGVQIDDEIMKEAQTTAAALRRRVSENVLRAKAIGTDNTFGAAEADAKLTAKAASARAVMKPTAEEVAEGQKLRLEAQKAGLAADSHEL